MPDAELAHRPGVELVNTGSWQLLSGSWNPNRTDILAAVEAAQCPAVRRPKLKLGHVDPRFNDPDDAQHDGTPSLGWFDNLRASDDGNTLIGDQVALPWLSQVQAAAYPDRSIEGTHNARCALGHIHPFVITAVSLLGETPPGIPTLKSIKSIDDLPAALGVAASGEDLKDGESVQATVRAAAEPAPDGDGDDDDEPTGAMVALIPTTEDAARLAVQGGLAAEDLHLTLAYLGDAASLDAAARQDLIDVVSSTVNGLPAIDAAIFSAAVYNPGDTSDRDTCLVYQVSGDLLGDVQEALDDALGDPDFSPEPWFAHVTALYSDDLGRLPDLVGNVGPVSFDRVRIAFAGQVIDIPLLETADTPATGMPSWLSDKYRGDPYMADVAAAASVSSKPWNPKPGDYTPAQWKTACLIDTGQGDPGDKGRYSLPVREPDGTLNKAAVHAAAARLNQVKADPAVKKAAAAKLVSLYGQLGETPPPSLRLAANKKVAASAPDLPAAEPEQPNTDPKEDLVSDLSVFRSRLGLDDTADEQTILSALDALKAKAETPAEPNPEMVAASVAATEQAKAAEAEKDELRKEVQILASQMKNVSDELAATKAEKAATVKASVFDAAILNGKIKPADRETWEKDYDEAPAAVTRVLASIAVGTAVPVMASGSIGDPEPAVDDDFEALIARIDAPTGKAV